MSTVVEQDWKTLTYNVNGMLSYRGGTTTLGGGTNYSWATSHLDITVCGDGQRLHISRSNDAGDHEVRIEPQDGYNDRVSYIRWRVEVWTHGVSSGEFTTDWYKIAQHFDGWPGDPGYHDPIHYSGYVAYSFAVSFGCDLMADWSETTGAHADIHHKKPGHGAELCREQSVTFEAHSDQVAVTASVADLDFDESQGFAAEQVQTYSGMNILLGVMGSGHRMPSGTLKTTASYNAWNGTSDFSEEYQRTVHANAGHAGSETFTDDVAVGAGGCSWTRTSDHGYYAGALFPNPSGGLDFRDYCCKTNGGGGRCDIRYMWEGSRDSNQDSWEIVGDDCHPVGIDDSCDWPDSGKVNYNDASLDLSYGGAWDCEVFGVDRRYRDTPQDVVANVFSHGNAFIADWIDPSYVQGLVPIGGVESFEGEPAHPPWSEADPEYYDESLYVKSPFLSMSEVLQFTVPAAGTDYASPLQFESVAGWDDTDCASSVDGVALKVVSGAADSHTDLTEEQGLGAGVWLNGRFAKVRWKCNQANKDAKLKIGPHEWNLAGGASGSWVDTEIDLLSPDSSDEGWEYADCQSIIGAEQPDNLTENGTWSHDDTEVDWVFHAGWGISRMTSVRLTCVENGATYWFDKLTLFRKAEEDGGFCKLCILPHQASWNDERSYGDHSLEFSGTHYEGAWSTGFFVYRKGFLVIDGAVVAEIVSGRLRDHPDGWMFIYSTLLTATDTEEKSHIWPLKDYADIKNDPAGAELATPGVSYTINIDSYTNAFLCDHFYNWGLVPGVYSPDEANEIKVGLDLYVRSIKYAVGLNASALWSGMVGRWRGQAYGLAFDRNGNPAANHYIPISTPNASSEHVTDTHVRTNALGYWESPPLNTKAAGLFGKVDDGQVTQTLRNRFTSRTLIDLLLWRPLPQELFLEEKIMVYVKKNTSWIAKFNLWQKADPTLKYTDLIVDEGAAIQLAYHYKDDPADATETAGTTTNYVKEITDGALGSGNGTYGVLLTAAELNHYQVTLALPLTSAIGADVCIQCVDNLHDDMLALETPESPVADSVYDELDNILAALAAGAPHSLGAYSKTATIRAVMIGGETENVQYARVWFTNVNDPGHTSDDIKGSSVDLTASDGTVTLWTDEDLEDNDIDWYFWVQAAGYAFAMPTTLTLNNDGEGWTITGEEVEGLAYVLTDLIALLQARLNDGDAGQYSTTDLGYWLNESYWEFLFAAKCYDATETTPSEIGEPNYSVGQVFQPVVVTYNGTQLKRQTIVQMDMNPEGWRSAANGTPTHWMREGNEIRVHPAPDTPDDDIVVYGYATPIAMTDSTSPDKIPLNYHFILLDGAEAKARRSRPTQQNNVVLSDAAEARFYKAAVQYAGIVEQEGR